MANPAPPLTTLPRAAGIYGVIGIVLVIAGGLAIRLAGNGPTALDTGWHDLLAASRNGFVEALALTLNVVGGTLAMTMVTAVIVAALVLARRWRQGITIGLSVAVAAGVGTILKLVISRPRPIDGIGDSGFDAFPSGHTTAAAAIAIGLAIAFPRVWTWVLAALWVVAMALSRTYLLVHWATDVLAAVVLGASAAVLVAAVMPAILKRVTDATANRSAATNG